MYYVYALGDYREVILIGLAGNIPRLVLYYFLIVAYEEVGAAIAFSLGFFSSLIAVVSLSKKRGYHLDLKNIGLLAAIPGLISLVLWATECAWIIGIPLIVGASYLLYARFRIISKNDLREMGEAFLSKEAMVALLPYIRPLLRVLYGE